MLMKRRIVSVLLSFVFTLSFTLPALASTSSTIIRLAGIDRYATAVAIAKEGWTQSDYAILVSGNNYPDALVATAVAKKYNAPLLLSAKDSLSPVTKQELTDLNVKKIILIGGTGVLSDHLYSELENMGIDSSRWAGKDRYETSLVVASQFSDISQIMVTTGEDFADALSIAPIAANKNMPIILVPKDDIPDFERDLIQQHNFSKTYIVGNTDQISDYVANQFSHVERITGATKYDRNIAVLNKFNSDLGGDHVYVATGNDFADALAGTALAAKDKSPLVLVDNTISNATRAYLDNVGANKELIILGGNGAVPDALLQNFVSSKAIPATSKVATSAVKPIFGGSFIQPWYCQDWDTVRWQHELAMLKDVGITEVIIQNTVDTTPAQKVASYPVSLAGYTSNDVDILDKVLSAADGLGMKVRVGTANNEEWWSKGATDNVWLANEANNNKFIIDDITSKYASHPSFGGWYLSYEISNVTATTSAEQANLNAFFKAIVSETKLKTPHQTVMVSPFYNSQLSAQGSLTNWATAIENIFSGTGVDILALQDSVGGGDNTISQLSSIFTATQKGTEAAGLKLYANTETYTSTASGNVTAPQNRITSQMEAENKFVSGYVAFSINHFQGKYCDEPIKVVGYNDYQSYYLAHK